MRTHTIVASGLVAGLIASTSVSARIFFFPSEETGAQSSAPSAQSAELSTTDTVESAGFRKIALRIQQRLERRGESSPSIKALTKAVKQGRELAKSRATVTVLPQGGNDSNSVTWLASVAEHPEWVVLERSWMDASYRIDVSQVQHVLHNPDTMPFARAQDSTITDRFTDKYKVGRVVSETTARAGFVFDENAAAKEIASALEEGKSHMTIVATYKPATITLPTANGPVELSLIATGRSNFAKSPDNRAWNVRMAFNDHINNIVIEPGKSLAFNDTLGGPVTFEKGWKEALGLFGGGAAMTPGGGICQAATTVYRAALLAGFPILKRRSHSLYVSYYEQYGVGVDATIFPGKQDLIFKNDTGAPVVLQAYTEGNEAFVNVFGVADGRQIGMEGPYFSRSKTRAKGLRGLSFKEIGWVRQVTMPDGSVRREPIISYYEKGVPSSIAKKYAEAPGLVTMHAAATVQ